jgi:2-polyprenyl-3-methyl-5-hydroxy-6-metoxy-1,4-benzoquinol methylase
VLERRSYEPEMMDDLTAGGPEMDQTLKELSIVGKCLGGYHVTLDGLEQILSRHTWTEEPVTIADLGCGGGDTLRVIADWGRKKKYNLKLIGIDANEFIVNYAREHSKDYPEIEYRHQDVFKEDYLNSSFDIVHCGLFCHHFVDGDLIYLLRHFKKQARLGVVINDLHRHWFAYYSIKILTKLFSKSKMVRNDASLSVARAFHKSELEAMLYKAGVPAYNIKWFWAWRWQVLY